jgi:hypothetical protein
MTEDREKHFRLVQRILAARLERKYRHGAKQHREKLWEKTDLLDEAIDEIELPVYLISERERRKNYLPALIVASPSISNSPSSATVFPKFSPTSVWTCSAIFSLAA